MLQNSMELSRRSLLKKIITVSPIILLGPTLLSTEEILAALPSMINKPKDPKKLTDHEKMHVPQLGLPPIAEDGAIVPTYVELPHPMEKDHYIKNVEIIFYTDPVVNKGKFHFTPANGQAYLSTQIRLGTSGQVVCISECNRDGKWIGVADVKVTVGGC